MSDHAELERRVRWLERHVRATGHRGNRLDPTPDMVERARLADRTRTLRAELLDPQTRGEAEAAVEARRQWKLQRRQRRSDAVRGSRGIAESTPGTPGRLAHEQTYLGARKMLKELADSREQIKQDATAAAARLRQDDDAWVVHAEEIELGEQARTELGSLLEAQINDAVEAADLLPVWFERELGMSPPADAEGWLRRAIEVLAYRATYAVRDQRDALGPAPEPPPIHRRRWYDWLTTELDDHRPPT